MVNKEFAAFLTILSSIFTTTGVLGLIANLMQLFFVCRDKKQRKSVFGMILLSLCVADIIVSVVQLYRGIIGLLTLLLVIDLKLLSKLLFPSLLAFIFSVASSFSHVVFIALLRVLSLVFPFRIKQIFTKLRSKIILVFLWLFSIGFIIIDHFTMKFLWPYLAITTSFILLLAYSIICYRMCKRRGIQGNESTQRNREQSDKYVFVYSMALTFIFCVCNLPAAISVFIEMPMVGRYVGIFLHSMNPLIDPLLYFFASYCKQRRANNALPNRDCQNQNVARAVNGNSQKIGETPL